ncbi:MAG: TatD family hydrolase [Bacteroidales bacterium]|nr:TatD family hydrolase [Bacteroidales bacterium]
MKFINIHTHKPRNSEHIVEVNNLFLQDVDSFPDRGLYSVGLHPWHISNDEDSIREHFVNLEKLIVQSRLLMVGECGLDRFHEIVINQQIPVFIEHLVLAQHYEKPVLIHSVKAVSDIISIRNKLRISVPFIFHGYNGNEEMTQQLMKNETYFSFGAALLTIKSLQDIFKEIPTNRIFLETDDSDIDIERIYEIAASILSISIEKLKVVINDNFTELFYK